MPRSTLKPIVSKLREAIIKGVAGKFEKYGFDENGVLTIEKPLSEYDEKIRENIIALFEAKHIYDKEKFVDYIHNTSRTFLHILICFKLMEKREIMGALLSRVLGTDIYNEIIPDFINVNPMAFDEFVSKFGDKISYLALKDNNEEGDAFYQFIYLMEVLTKEMSQEVPLLFKEYEYNLIQPDYDDLRVILQQISTIANDEFKEDDFLGWIYQYWVDTEDSEIEEGNVLKDVSYANNIYYRVLVLLDQEQSELGEFYTPRWIVKHIVDSAIKCFKEKNNIPIENIKLLDPACGAGNFLVYSFDAILRLYDLEHPDWNASEKVLSILKNNIYGADVQREPLQITALNLWIKAKVYAVNAKIGSMNLVNVNVLMANSLYPWELKDEYHQISIFDTPESLLERKYTSEDIGRLLSNRNEVNYNNAIKFFKQKFEIIVMNPPFVDARKMNSSTSDLIKEYYPDNTRNLFGAFIERALGLLKKKGVLGFISSDTYFTISSFQKLRFLLLQKQILEVDLLGNGVFDGPAVSAAIMLVCNNYMKSNIIRINTYKNSDTTSCEISMMDQVDFSGIPSTPFIFEISETFMKLLIGNSIGDYKNDFEVRKGIVTSNNDKYLKYKWEVPSYMIGKEFLLYNKDIENISYSITQVLDCRKETVNEMLTRPSSRLAYLLDNYDMVNNQYDFKSGVLFNLTGNLKACELNKQLFDVSFPAVICRNNKDRGFILALLLSKFAKYCLGLLNTTMHTTPGDVRRLPLKMPENELKKEFDCLINDLLVIKHDLDMFNPTNEYFKHTELEFGFMESGSNSLDEAYDFYCKYASNKLIKCNELYEKLNNKVYMLYGLKVSDIRIIESSVKSSNLITLETDKKKLILRFLQNIVIKELNENCRLYLVEDIKKIIQEYCEIRFDKGYELYYEFLNALECDIQTLLTVGVSISNRKATFFSTGKADIEQPFIQHMSIAGKGNNSEIVYWHISQFLIEFEEDKRYAMQNEIRRLTNEVYLPKLQRAKEKLQSESLSASEKKVLQNEITLYEECIRSLENWKVVD